MMNNQQKYATGYDKNGLIKIGKTTQPEKTFPIQCFPDSLKNAAIRIFKLAGIPIELTASTMLATLSLVCQYLICIISPGTGMPGPCSLYLVTLAESGEGKTFISRLIMKPVHQLLEKMSKEHKKRLGAYKTEYDIWKTAKQGFEASLRRAIKTDCGMEDVMEQLRTHSLKKPARPVEPKFILEDVTGKALIQMLSEHSALGIFTDEAISFFNGPLKKHLGLLNKAWDGGTYSLNRADGESYEVELCLMMLLMIQPGVFSKYLEKNGTEAKESGFMARILFTNVNSSIGKRSSFFDDEGINLALQPLHERISKILTLLEARFYDKSIPKEEIRLSDDAKEVIRKKKNEIEAAIAPKGGLAHVRDVGAKAIEQACRIAAIFVFFEFKPVQDNEWAEMFYNGEISGKQMSNAIEIVDYFIMQSSGLFYPMSEEYLRQQDGRNLWCFINKKLVQNQGRPFPKHELLQYGPSRLRQSKRLTPILDQLINQNLCCIITIGNSRTEYIAGILYNGNICTGGECFYYNIVQRQNLNAGNSSYIDVSDLPTGA